MITTCTKCGRAYEAGSEEQANEPERFCFDCRKPDRNPSEIAQARERGRKLGYDIPRFREEECGGAFDGNRVISDADPGL